MRKRTLCALAFAALATAACTRHPDAIRLPPEPETRSPAAAAPLSPPEPPRIFSLTAIGDTRTGSMLALASRNGRTVAYVADEDDRAVRAVDLETHAELAPTPLPGRPGNVLITKQGRIAVALRDEAAVALFAVPEDPRLPLVEIARLATATEPIALALTPDGKSILVASAVGAKLEAFDTASGERAFAIDVPAEPRVIAVAGDGARAFVGHATSGSLTVVELSHAATLPVDMGAKGVGPVTPIAMPKANRIGLDAREDFGWSSTVTPPRVSRQSFALAVLASPPAYGRAQPDHVIAPHVLVDSGPAGVVTSGYGASIDADPQVFEIDVLDAATGARTTQSMLSAALLQRGRSRQGSCLLPRAAVADAKRRRVDVACLGADAILEYPADWDANSLLAAEPRRRWSVGSGPVGLAIDPERDALVAWSAFDRIVTVIPLGEGDAKESFATTRIALAASSALPPQVAEGRGLFHAAGDPRISKDGRACASCHPDGRDDRLVWSTPEGPRQTPVLAGRVASGPYGWSGKRPTLAAHLVETVKNLKGSGLTDSERDALAAYVTWAPPPPRRPTPDSPELALRGSAIFHSAEAACATCHHADDGFADHETHDVGSATRADKFRELRTPSLRGVGASAPYFHDGRYATLRDLLRGSDGMMGNTKHLSGEELSALEAYLGTL